MPPLTFYGTPLRTVELALIRTCVARYEPLSRAELAATVCEWLDWQRPNGHLKTRECRDLLERLDACGQLALPALRAGRPRGAATAVPHGAHGDPHAPLSAALRSLQPIALIRVEQPAEHALWRELMGRHHYLGYRTAYGASLWYLIQAGAGPERILGGLQFSSPAWRMHARDAWIGWDEATRTQHLQRVVNNSRFLILPWVHVPHLASHVLALALHRVPPDWEAATACGRGWRKPSSIPRASPVPATAPPTGSTWASPPAAVPRTVPTTATASPPNASSSIRCAFTPGTR